MQVIPITVWTKNHKSQNQNSLIRVPLNDILKNISSLSNHFHVSQNVLVLGQAGMIGTILVELAIMKFFLISSRKIQTGETHKIYWVHSRSYLIICDIWYVGIVIQHTVGPYTRYGRDIISETSSWMSRIGTNSLMQTES